MSEHIPAGYSSAQDYARAQAAMGGNYGRGVGRAEVLPAPVKSKAILDRAPLVSQQYLQAEHEKRVVAETSSWFDWQIGNGRAVNGVSSDHDPAGYLRQHGFVAVNGAGEQIDPSPTQARGLVAQLIKAMEQQGSRTSPRHVTQGISYRDGNRPPAQQLVQLRRAF